MLTPMVKQASFKLDLEQDEHIKEAKAYSQNLVDRLEFTTSLGRVLCVGRDASPDDLVSAIGSKDDDSRLISFNCGLGGHIHNIEFTFHGKAYQQAEEAQGGASWDQADPRRCPQGHWLQSSWTVSRLAGTQHADLTPFRCDLCGEGFDDHDLYYCSICGFDVHPACQGLPRRAPKSMAEEMS